MWCLGHGKRIINDAIILISLIIVRFILWFSVYLSKHTKNILASSIYKDIGRWGIQLKQKDRATYRL